MVSVSFFEEGVDACNYYYRCYAIIAMKINSTGKFLFDCLLMKLIRMCFCGLLDEKAYIPSQWTSPSDRVVD